MTSDYKCSLETCHEAVVDIDGTADAPDGLPCPSHVQNDAMVCSGGPSVYAQPDAHQAD